MPEEKQTKEQETNGIEVNLIPNNQISTNRVYSNYVQIARSPYDFTLRFCDAGPISNTKEIIDNNGNFNVPVVAEIAIPLNMMPNLIKALKSQLEKHLEPK
ncbi:MAG: DUF3467 domain-containing protein [Nitrospina sp.]|jgi:hypothetical protein|nr:DUF3467 domain-containing protein [Nitrospina sp.]MBT7178200.1 DUF3467 domain-containing protein [Nitrospina sp.]